MWLLSTEARKKGVESTSLWLLVEVLKCATWSYPSGRRGGRKAAGLFHESRHLPDHCHPQLPVSWKISWRSRGSHEAGLGRRLHAFHFRLHSRQGCKRSVLEWRETRAGMSMLYCVSNRQTWAWLLKHGCQRSTNVLYGNHLWCWYLPP